jgi:dihydroorotate dehydrogenase
MKYRNADFGRVWGASGVRGFFDEGYWFHKWWRPFGLRFDGATFVAKTTTLQRREGNMPLKPNLTPQERMPKCVIVKPLKGVALNAVGLSGPGALSLLARGRWQRMTNPFLISFMSVAERPDERIDELRKFVTLLRGHLRDFWGPVGLQINYSCPNVGVFVRTLTNEIEEGLAIASELRIPIFPKFSVVMSPEVAADIVSRNACEGVCISNTVPWGVFPDRIDWKGLFGSDVSPLAHVGGGGLSGKPLLPLLIEWVRRARSAGLVKHVNAGGGILSKRDAKKVFAAGADSISLGSIAFLRPWRVAGIVRSANGHA